jgi:hypothetical protein
MLPGEETTLAFTTTTSATTARYYLTSVPDESALTTGFLVDAAGEYISTFTPDVAGAYGVRADLYWKRVGSGSTRATPRAERGRRSRNRKRRRSTSATSWTSPS